MGGYRNPERSEGSTEQPRLTTPLSLLLHEALTRLRSTSILADPEILFRYAKAKDRVIDLELGIRFGQGYLYGWPTEATALMAKYG